MKERRRGVGERNYDLISKLLSLEKLKPFLSQPLLFGLQGNILTNNGQ